MYHSLDGKPSPHITAIANNNYSMGTTPNMYGWFQMYLNIPCSMYGKLIILIKCVVLHCNFWATHYKQIIYATWNVQTHPKSIVCKIARTLLITMHILFRYCPNQSSWAVGLSYHLSRDHEFLYYIMTQRHKAIWVSAWMHFSLPQVPVSFFMSESR